LLKLKIGLLRSINVKPGGGKPPSVSLERQSAIVKIKES